MGLLDKIFGNYSKKELARIEPIKNKVLELEEKYQAMSDEELGAQTAILKGKVDELSTLDDVLPDALAVAREAAFRVLGKKPYPVQIIGAIVLHQGRIAEMKTGEGKTLVACLAAYANSLDGKGVHVVTVNDYLAKFQSEEMGKVFNFLNTSIGCVLTGMNKEEKRIAYNCDVTYGTNTELGFDYLRDNMVTRKEEKVQREHSFAIVDEVDSILIDEARTPLIISGQGDKSTELYAQADVFAKTLKPVTVVEMDDKADNDLLDGDYIIDEKAKTATLTKSGVKKAEKFFNIVNLMDQENMTIAHHVNQAIKANGVMKNGVDYIVNENNEVMIVDEFTGRVMEGRRFNDGLHQAIEAKEGVEVKRESKTIATITYQNYFRLYSKLSGMTGTALTEEDEFREIYKLDVIEVPTNRPVIRQDHPDVVYKTERAKYHAIIDQIIACHEKGQPVLVGTVSIEKSEILSKLLKARAPKIKHQVLNAKYHDKEAMIVAQAGTYGAVTIATNMAGRGTDIMLGGNAEYLSLEKLQAEGYTEDEALEAASYSNTKDERILEGRKRYRQLYADFSEKIAELAEKVKEAGGLYIIGTERHESRRIDNQLRGRSGRQGDPGESTFFLSLEDDLMRIFGGDRITGMMDALNVDENTPISAKMLSGVIESSQKKIEGRNFNIRKNVLNYDDVMNTQREIIYGQRQMVLNGEDVHEYILDMIRDFVNDAVDLYLVGDIQDDWNLIGLRESLMGLITVEGDLTYTTQELDEITKEDIRQQLIDRALKVYERKEEQNGCEYLSQEIERVCLLNAVDAKWMDHIDDMEELKKGISLRSYGQKNPVVEYRMEGMDMFDEMVKAIREQTVRMLLTFNMAMNLADNNQDAIHLMVMRMMKQYVEELADKYLPDNSDRALWDFDGLSAAVAEVSPLRIDFSQVRDSAQELDRAGVVDQLTEHFRSVLATIEENVKKQCIPGTFRRKENIGFFGSAIGTKWMNNVEDLEELKKSFRVDFIQRNGLAVCTMEPEAVYKYTDHEMRGELVKFMLVTLPTTISPAEVLRPGGRPQGRPAQAQPQAAQNSHNVKSRKKKKK